MTNEMFTRQRWPVKLARLIVDFELLSWSSLGCYSPPLTLNLQLRSVMSKGVVIVALRANTENRRVSKVEEGLFNVEENVQCGQKFRVQDGCETLQKPYSKCGRAAATWSRIKGKEIVDNRGLGLSGLS